MELQNKQIACILILQYGIIYVDLLEVIEIFNMKVVLFGKKKKITIFNLQNGINSIKEDTVKDSIL